MHFDFCFIFPIIILKSFHRIILQAKHKNNTKSVTLKEFSFWCNAFLFVKSFEELIVFSYEFSVFRRGEVCVLFENAWKITTAFKPWTEGNFSYVIITRKEFFCIFNTKTVDMVDWGLTVKKLVKSWARNWVLFTNTFNGYILGIVGKDIFVYLCRLGVGADLPRVVAVISFKNF